MYLYKETFKLKTYHIQTCIGEILISIDDGIIEFEACFQLKKSENPEIFMKQVPASVFGTYQTTKSKSL